MDTDLARVVAFCKLAMVIHEDIFDVGSPFMICLNLTSLSSELAQLRSSGRLCLSELRDGCGGV
jgi:hypothetical protein